ncbi:hypothetical protein [Rhizobium leguminosarum]
MMAGIARKICDDTVYISCAQVMAFLPTRSMTALSMSAFSDQIGFAAGSVDWDDDDSGDFLYDYMNGPGVEKPDFPFVPSTEMSRFPSLSLALHSLVFACLISASRSRVLLSRPGGLVLCCLRSSQARIEHSEDFDAAEDRGG